MFEFDPRFRHYNSGFALTRGSGVVGTWVPAGTHRISENLGTDGYQVPARKIFWVPMGTGSWPNFQRCRPLFEILFFLR